MDNKKALYNLQIQIETLQKKLNSLKLRTEVFKLDDQCREMLCGTTINGDGFVGLFSEVHNKDVKMFRRGEIIDGEVMGEV